MRTLLLASAALLALGGAVSAQNAPNNPKSGQASNIDSATTHSALAPALPSPGGPDAGAEQYLNRARQALRANRTGEAQEALERAETRLLDRSTAIGTNDQPDSSPRVQAVRDALMALSRHDRAGAMRNIDMAMNTQGGAGAMGNMQGMSGGTMAPGTMAPGTMAPGAMTPAATMAPSQVAPAAGYGMGAPPNGGTAAANTQIYSSCPTPPCVQGTPPAAPGGGGGSGPAALRTSPSDSPVATGAGAGNSNSNGAKGSGGNGSGSSSGSGSSQ